MHELIPVTKVSMMGGPMIQAVDARELHGFLEIGRDYTTWIKDRIATYKFIEGSDFEVFAKTGGNPAHQNGGAGNRGKSTEYTITLDMAKELAMVERNEKGRQARRYFIDCERQLKTAVQPSQAHMDLLVRYLQREVERLSQENHELEASNHHRALEALHRVPARTPGRLAGVPLCYAIRAVAAELGGKAEVFPLLRDLQQAGVDLGKYPLRNIMIALNSRLGRQMFAVAVARTGDDLVSLLKP